MASGDLLIAGAIALAIIIVGLSIADVIRRANEIEITTPYTTIRASEIASMIEL